MNLFSLHRFEEILERFRLEGVRSDDSHLQLPFSALSHIHGSNRRPLSSATASHLAQKHGLHCNEDAICLPLTGKVSSTEDALVAFLGDLLENDPKPFFEMPRRGAQIPPTHELPRSARWLERFYSNGFLPKEKKPMVIDLAQCPGPYLRSCDDEPLQILDSASQIASLPAGVRPGAVQASVDDGRMDTHMVAALPVT
ncbi:MAG: hypothetical protein VX223_06250, partial [Myxococcota bacterium]|nr:hypothetical protein [Myxococcota bacterium]